MAKRDAKRLADFHLWTAVAETVDPLRPKRLYKIAQGPLPIPDTAVHPSPPAPQKPRRAAPITMPAYQAPPAPKRHPGHAIEPRLRRKVARGRIEINGTIDLHGMRQTEAHQALNRFVRARVARGDRTILVITGKGLRQSDDLATTFIERGILRAMLPMWLSEPGLAPMIAGWNAAAQHHGGDGAYYVRLRRP
ncbi:Smr/MutS family protein [Devosia algicola]|uniref:Smr/MutS family protein n=1 Tax=Devosia algicola TaxID=3026418 RepID=A0ABY7YKI5_9HYPH|nr:Smr/MutS family protein [Devosia algicola]WDR01799.1 Smr/MutS family protein [Devosia algicola]